MKRVCIALGVWLCCALTWAGPTDPNDIRVVQNNANVPSNGTPGFTSRPGQEVQL